ncbi:MAG: helix-turn-helix domain-containing protein [Chitinophagaceae bacterium]|nr:helix-turn-helix domain-containing protein [Chitinophagaceae bacterium]
MNHLRNQKLLGAFGAKLKELRQAKSMTLESLAYECEMELSQIHRIEQDKINPALSTIEALTKGFNLSISDLLKGV